MGGYLIHFAVHQVARRPVPRRRMELSRVVQPRMYAPLSRLFLSSTSTARKRRIMIKIKIRIKAGRRRGRKSDRRRSLNASQVCGLNGGTPKRRGTSEKRRKRRRKRGRKRPRGPKIKTWDLQPLGMRPRQRRLRHSLRYRHNLMRGRLCWALARYGVVVAHALVIMSSGSLELTVARRSVKQRGLQLRPRLPRAVL
jgi:hypothetical protein